MAIFKVYQFLVLYVLVCTGIFSVLHQRAHGGFCLPQVGLAFFLCLNFLICLWEISLGWHIDFIKKECERLHKKYKGNRLAACMSFFAMDLEAKDLFSGRFWSIVWSTYALYDPSYANRESFGFFIDVGNGWTTLIPTALFLVGMTFGVVPARVLGMVGLAKFYQVRH